MSISTVKRNDCDCNGCIVDFLIKSYWISVVSQVPNPSPVLNNRVRAFLFLCCVVPKEEVILCQSGEETTR